jgi:two-component system sensor histidine kinase FlrB
MRTLMEAPQIAETHLADAFQAFIGAANRLEDSHGQLHYEVAELRKQLEARNRALASSVAETERVRFALRQIMDALPCGVAVLETRSEEIVLLNPEARRLLATPEPSGWQSLPGCVRTTVHNVGDESLEHGYEQEVALESDGRKLWLAIRYCRMTSPASQKQLADSSCLVLIIRDVTAHKNMEQERENSRNVVALAEMATVLAHEIRNPLGSLELLTGCLAGDSALGDDSKQCVEHLIAGVRSLSATVNNVLCFHDPGAQEMAALDLASALKASVDFVQPLARQKGVILTLRENLKGAKIIGNADGLRQIMLNLACNALRHTRPGGEIRLTALVEMSPRGRMAVVEFSDTGSGIRPEDMPHIFKMGFTTTGHTPGLGLAVCQRIVEQLGGAITARSRLGRGTTFRMQFSVS